MGGAYTAQPGAVPESPEIPEGWPEHWPFPGPLPPGYTPSYAINFKSPPTPEEVAVGEEITVRVKVYQEGIGDPPSQLGTIQPNENIAWSAFIDGEEIDSSSEGWTYISGRYYSSWTFTPSLTGDDVETPPKVMTVIAEGTMNNGSFSSSLSAEEGIDVVEKFEITFEVAIDSYSITGSPTTWTINAHLNLTIGVTSYNHFWRVNKANETFHAATANPTLPDGITMTPDIPNRKLTINIPPDVYDPDGDYRAYMGVDASISFGTLNYAISSSAQIVAAEDFLTSEMLASGAGTVLHADPTESSFAEIYFYSGESTWQFPRFFGLFSDAIITNY